jgi:hypothetical protein
MANTTGTPALRTAKNWSAIVLLIVIPTLGTLGYVLWELHTPRTTVRTPVPITRNSLLPHQFAGVCENCHRVIEVGPVEMSRDNMRLFNLTQGERQLLVAGQRVDAPSLLQRARVPAITRSDSLPHPFVGVCSNCHIVLDVGPSPELAQASMQRAYRVLVPADIGNERVARGGTHEREGREFLRNLFGFLALALFLCASVYIGMRFLMKTWPETYKGKFKIKPWFVTHEWASTAFCMAAILHWYYSDRGNTFLHAALLIVIWLTVAGYVLRYRVTHSQTQKNLRLLHTQRGLYLGLIILLVVGHLFAEFY